jgi:hypothetical protein
MSDPEAEYLAAKELFLAAQMRLHAAKAAMKPIWEAKAQAERAEAEAKARRLVHVMAEVIAAYVDGMPQSQALKMMKERGYSASWMGATVADFCEEVGIRDEFYRNYIDGEKDQARYRRLGKLALERYRERLAA